MAKALFPGFRYGPKGECELFQSEDDVPKGWHRNTPEGLAKLEQSESLDDKTVDELEALLGDDLANVEGTGSGGRVLKKDLIAALEGRDQ